MVPQRSYLILDLARSVGDCLLGCCLEQRVGDNSFIILLFSAEFTTSLRIPVSTLAVLREGGRNGSALGSIDSCLIGWRIVAKICELFFQSLKLATVVAASIEDPRALCFHLVGAGSDPTEGFAGWRPAHHRRRAPGRQALPRRAQTSLPWLFVTQRGEQFTRQGIAYIVREAGERAKLGHVWPHMLRHSCGYHLANRDQVPDLRLIQDYLGHKNIKNTARYTRTSARRFEGLWD